MPVTLPSGAVTLVLTDEEERYVNDRVARYLSDNAFTNVADLQDVDRLITFELFVHRWSLWLTVGKDYFDEAISEKPLGERINLYSREARLLKSALGLDKKARDRAKGEGSVNNYLDMLRLRAREFGYKRNQEAAKAIELMQQMKALATLHANCDEQERREWHCEATDVVEWILTVAVPEFDAIDEAFRAEQRMWIRDM